MIDPIHDLAVRRAYAAYAHRIDDGDIRGWSRLFSEDGVMRVRGTEHRGPESLYRWMAAAREDGVESLGRHLVMNVEVLSADTSGAEAVADFLHVVSGSSGAVVEMVGRYLTRFSSTPEGYAFADHEVRLLVDRRDPRAFLA
jgi:ketosteroid isomerase-like protein